MSQHVSIEMLFANETLNTSFPLTGMLASGIIILGGSTTTQFANASGGEGCNDGGGHDRGRIDGAVCVVVVHELGEWIWA